jgi:hypothetical protein
MSTQNKLGQSPLKGMNILNIEVKGVGPLTASILGYLE